MDKVMIFDMDGVIVDSEYTFLESKTQILLDEGIDTDVTYQYQFMGTTFDFMWQYMKKDLNLKKEVSDYIADMNNRRDVMMARDGIRPIKGAQDFIHWLFDNGYRLAVASSSPKHEIIRNLEELGLSDCFEIKVSGEEVAHSKPEPDVYLYAAELLGVDPKVCLAIEDTKNGSKSAKAAGMYVYGFENPDYPAQDLSAADTVVTTYDDHYAYFEEK